MPDSTLGSEAALLREITLVSASFALASLAVWLVVFIVRVVRLRQARREALAEEELTTLVLDTLASYRTEVPWGAMPRWKRGILRRVIQSLVNQTKGRDQAQMIALLDRLGFRDDALESLRSARAAERQAACATLAYFNEPACEAALNAALGDPDFGVRLTAAQALLERDKVPSLRRLLEQVRFNRDDPPLSLAELFARLPASLREEAVSLLDADLPAEWTRTLAIALARAQAHEAYEPIARLRHHLAERVRAAAWVALRELGDPRAGEIIADGLRDPIMDVRRAATDCAGKLGGAEVVPVLERLAADPDWWMSFSAAAALWDTGENGRMALISSDDLGAGARQLVREKQQEAGRG